MSDPNLYQILGIPEDIIISQEWNINYWLGLIDSTDSILQQIQYLSEAIQISDKFHSYIHFEQSFAYLISAYRHFLQDQSDKVAFYLSRAIFQDHGNKQALGFNQNIKPGHHVENLQFILQYENNFLYEHDFLLFALGSYRSLPSISELDKTMHDLINNIAISQIDEMANACKKLDYTSHRVLVAKSLVEIKEKRCNAQSVNMLIQNLEDIHEKYHFFASNLYRKRAQKHNALQYSSLAKNDIIKANALVGIDN